MSLFSFVSDTKYPQYYDVCQKTGVRRYKLAETRVYGDTYFAEEYKAQYQKTYYEDEKNLRALANRRLDLLPQLGNNNHQKRLLEIGCSAGFFLSEATKRGYLGKGLELSPKEAFYANDVLGLDVENRSILSEPTSTWKEYYSVIACFFVLEHIPEQEEVWERFSNWLEPGGHLLLSLPSFYGPTFMTNPNEWFRTHPKDHFFDYDPKSLKKLLSILGFELNCVRPMSYHPYRDQGILGKIPTWLYRSFAKTFAYGDTIELLATKRK